MVVDAHAHVFERVDVSPRGTDALAPADRTATLADFVDRLAGVGATSAVLVPLDAHDDYVAACVADDPEHFRGVAVASPVELGLTDADPVAMLTRRRERFAFSAVRTMWLGEPGSSIAESPALPLLRSMESSGLILWSYLPPEQAPFLEQLGAQLPDLRVVLNHFGFTPVDMRVDSALRPRFEAGLTRETVDRVAALSRFPNYFLMFSGQYALSTGRYPYRDLHEAGARLVDAFAPERTLWGSDWPWIDADPGYAEVADLIDATLGSYSESDRDRIRGGTAAALFDFQTTDTDHPQRSPARQKDR